MIDSEKKYVVVADGKTYRFSEQDWSANMDEFMKDFPQAEIAEVESYKADDYEDNDNIVVRAGDRDFTFSGKDWKANESEFMKDFPGAQIARVRGVDYHYNQANKLENDINAKDEEIKAWQDSRADRTGMDWSSVMMQQSGLSPIGAGIDPERDAALATYAAEGTRLQQERDELQKQFDSNPRVIEARERAKQMEQEYEDNLLKEINATLTSYDTDKDVVETKMREIDARMSALDGQYGAILPQIGPSKETAEKVRQFDKMGAAKEMIEHAKDIREGKTEGFWQGGAHFFEKEIEGIMYQTESDTMVQIAMILKDLNDKVGNLNKNLTPEVIDENLSKDDALLLRAYFSMMSAQKEVGTGWRYKAGEIAAAAIPFALEFAAIGGFADDVAKGATKGLQLGLERWVAEGIEQGGKAIGRKVGKYAAEIGTKGLIKAAMMTAMRPSTYSTIAQHLPTIDEEGNVKLGKNATIGALDSFIETISELSGGVIEDILGLGMKWGKGVTSKIFGDSVKNIKFGKWAKALTNGAFGDYLKQAGFHGLPTEIMEEYIGNTMRLIYDKNALKEMHEDGNGAAMWLGFVPMTLFGGAMSAGAFREVDQRAAQIGEKLNALLLEKEFTKERADALTERRTDKSPLELGIQMNELREELKKKGATQEELEMVDDYAIAVAEFQTMRGVTEIREKQDLDEVRADLTRQYGTYAHNGNVTTAKTTDGRDVFVVSDKSATGEYAAVDMQTGQHITISDADIATQNNAQGQPVQVLSSKLENQYIGDRLLERNRLKEAERMLQERNEQIAKINELMPDELNLGTEGEPNMVVVKSKDAKGVTVVNAEGGEAQMSWDAVGRVMGMPIHVFSDMELAEMEAQEIALKREALKAERAKTYAENNNVSEELNQIKEKLNDITPKPETEYTNEETGEVDEVSFWENDPEGFCEWNDRQNKDGGADSIEQVENAINSTSALLDSATKAMSTDNPISRKAAKREAQRLTERLQRLRAIQNGYLEKFTEQMMSAFDKAEERAEALIAMRERINEWREKFNLDESKLVVYESLDEVERDEWRRQIMADETPGWQSGKKAYIYLPHVKDMSMLDKTVMHEVVTHFGLKTLLGEKDYNTLMDKVWNMMSDSARRTMSFYPGVQNKEGDARRRAAAEEFVAMVGEHIVMENASAEQKSMWKRVADSIAEKFDTMQTKLNGVDVAGIVKDNYTRLEAKAKEEAQNAKEAETEAKAEEAEEAPAPVEVVTNIVDAAQTEEPSINLAPKDDTDYSTKTESYLVQQIRGYAKSKEGKKAGWTDKAIEEIIAETSALITAIHNSSTGNEFYDEFAAKDPTFRLDWRDGQLKPTVTWTRGNIEYKYDMSADLLCVNNEGLEEVLSSEKIVALMPLFNMSKKDEITTKTLDGKEKTKKVEIGFSQDDYLELYNTLKDLGFVVPCKGCFDAAGRFKMLPSVAYKFAAAVNAVIDERNADPEAFDAALKSKVKKNAAQNGLPTSAKTKLDAIRAGVAGDNLTEHVKWTQLMSADGQTKMLSDWGGIFRAWQRTGAGRPKDKLLPEPYYGDIVSSHTTIIGAYGDKTPSFRDIDVNQGTGLRRNSHSEFRPVLAIDEIQFMRDAFIKNLTVFKYMKELDDVRLFGKMGVKFNMSFFPEFVSGTKAAGLDANGNYIPSEESVGAREFPYKGEDGKVHYDGMKGWKEAQKHINKDVSLSSVILSIPHLIKAMTDVPTTFDKSGMWGSLIPFHSSGATSLALFLQGLGKARANGVGHGFEEAFTRYDEGVTNFEAVQNDRFGKGWVIVEGKEEKVGTVVEEGHKLEFVNGKHYYNSEMGLHLFASMYIFDSELPEGALNEDSTINLPAKELKKIGHAYEIDYNNKVREIGTPIAYAEAADYYLDLLPKLGLKPRFDFDVPEEIFLQMCEDANVDPMHPKLGWKGAGNAWNPIHSAAYYSLFCDYGMTDPATGEWAPHNPVGYVNENGEREFRMPENTVEIVKEGLERYSNIRRSESSKIDEAIKEFARRSVEKGRISQDAVDSVLGNEDTMFKTEYDRTPPPREAVAKIIDYLFANKDKNKGVVERRVISAVTPRQIEEYRKKGIDNVTENFVHSIDNSSIRHKVKRHGGDNRTQEPLSKEEWHNILDVIENFDRVDKQKSKSGLDVIVYQKKYDDGTIYYVEEIRTGRESLALTTAYKKRGDSSGLMEHALPPTSETTLDNTSFESKDTNKSDTTNDFEENTFFKTSNRNQAIFVSNAAKAVEGIQMGKATPEQWLKMLEKNGGLKAGEDKWMGLSDWLKASDKKTLTKDEVMQFVNEHMIQIEEVHYAANAESDAEYTYVEIQRILQDKFDGYMQEYYESHDVEDDYGDEARDYAMDKLHEEFNDEFPYTIERSQSDVYLTFPYEEVEDLEEWATKVGIDFKVENPIEDTRLKYTTEDLGNKREIALTVPTIESWNADDATHFGDAGDGRAVAWIRFGETTDESGNKVLVIDEIQSKRHQEGREKGYESDFETSDKLQELNTQLEEKVARRGELIREKVANEENEQTDIARLNIMLNEVENVRDYDRISEEIASREAGIENRTAEIETLSTEIKEIESNIKREEMRLDYKMSEAVKNAPFEKNWHELAMKRMLRYAAENGYDYIAWTKGDQQAERYNIGGEVKSIERNRVGDNQIMIHIFTKPDRKIIIIVDNEGKDAQGNEDFLGKSLSEILGKEMADKVLNAADGTVLDGEGLKIGGEGMKGFYDQILPKFMDKYGKKWGIKTENIKLSGLNNQESVTMHSIPVTEEMKESVMEGQTMFKTRMPNQSVANFLNEVVPEFESKYNIVAPATIMKLPTISALAKALKLDVSEISDEVYDEFLKKWNIGSATYIPIIHEDGSFEHNIIIFANGEYTTSFFTDISMFHENIHGLVMENEELLSLGGWLYETDIEDKFINGIRPLTDKYTEAWKHEEMLTHYVSAAMGLGFSQRALDTVPEEYKPLLNYIYERFGYNPETEDGERRRRVTSERSEIAGRTWTDRPSIKVTESERETGSGETLFKSAITPEVRKEMDVIAAQAIVNGNYLKAPNGKDTKLTPEQWSLVRTQNFFDWFGDWINDPENASKVVDENGEPMVVYHGTLSSKFTTFDDSVRKNSKAPKGTYWFAEQKDNAMTYASGEEGVYATFLNLRNPAIVDAKDGAWYELPTDFEVYDGEDIDEVFDTYEEAIAFARENGIAEDSIKPIGVTDTNAFVQRAKDSGKYDGAIISNVIDAGDQDVDYEVRPTNEYVVFSPNQIKSATENNGEYSESEDIRFKTAYHGSSYSFESFSLDHGKQGGSTRSAYFKPFGIYATDIKGRAMTYAQDRGEGRHLYELEIPDDGLFDFEGMFSREDKQRILDYIQRERPELYNKAKRAIGVREGKSGYVISDFLRPMDLKALGYKGFVKFMHPAFSREGDPREFAIFNPQDIKVVNHYATQPGESDWFDINAVNDSESDNTMFKTDPSTMSVDELVEQGKQKVIAENRDAIDVFMDRIRAINGNLQQLRMAAAAQRQYDKRTVDAIVKQANELLEGGKLADLTRGEIKRILSVVNNATGKADLTKEVGRLMDIMIANQLRMGRENIDKFLRIRGKKVDQRGVEVRGRLDIKGQLIMDAVRENIGNDLVDILMRIVDVQEKLTSESETVRRNAENELVGLEFARQYVENIKDSEKEEKRIRQEIKDAEQEYKDGVRDRKTFVDFANAANEAIRENRIQRVLAYEKLAEDLAKLVTSSITNAGLLRDAEKERVQKIQHFANSDLQGLPYYEHGKVDNYWLNNPLVRFLLKPLATFDQMLRHFGSKNANGEGYLWNHFMRGWLKATETEYKGVQAAHDILDAKAREVFRREGIKRWSDIFEIDRKLPTATVTWWDGGEMRDHEVTQGNLLYIYMVNKMTDGKMKLRKMGITEDDVDSIKNALDPRFIALADWIQDEFLPSLRDKYNALHEKLFGASMAAIDSYFPIRVLANAREREVDLGVEESSARPSTITGSIIKRTRNSLALDILGSNAFDVVLDHIQQMEHWAAFAEFNQDLNTLLSYRRFRNRVQNMSGIYGSGNVVWNNFRSVAELAAGVYQPASKSDSIDKTALNLAKGVTAAKISFRVYTAMKQLLSMPAFISDARTDILLKNILTPWNAWKWSMENLPLFEKRWKSRQAGDSRLMQTDSDWKIWKSKVVELASRYGMSPNAFVDAVTVAIGARSVFETKEKEYKAMGYSDEEASTRAKQDATIIFNESQQSNESAFLSTMQVDRTVSSVAFSLFRNSAMGYQRMFVDALRNIKHKFARDYRQQSIEFMQKQMIRDGVAEEDAERAAKRMYARSIMQTAMRAVTFGFVVEFAWNLGAYLPYLIAGDDDDEKRDMVKDAARHALFGPIEGLSGGSLISEAGNLIASGEGLANYDPTLLPVVSDMKRLFSMLSYDEVAAANEMFNMLLQAGIGVNPQTITDAAVAIVDACNGDLKTAKEATLCLLRILQIPQTQADKIYIDEIDFTADKGLELTIYEFAKRYADYKVKRGAPLTGWMYSDEKEKEREDKYIKRFTDMAEEYKRSRGNEEAKKYYEYLDTEYKEVTETIADLKSKAQAEGMKGNMVGAMEYAEMLDEFMKTEVFQRYTQYGGMAKAVEKLRDQLLKVDNPTMEMLEDIMLDIRKEMVEEMEKAND